MTPPVSPRLAGLSQALLVAAVSLALSACELGLYGHEKATTAGCEPWQVGCPIAVDVAGDGPIQPTRYDAERAAIVGSAERAPVRSCPELPLLCQARTIGDVIDDQYLTVVAD